MTAQYKQKLLPSFLAERIVVTRKVIPHKRHGVIVRFRTKTIKKKQRYRIRWVD
jgi:hypothetical protein